MKYDFENMSKEELIRIVLEQSEQLTEQTKILEQKTTELETLRVSHRDMISFLKKVHKTPINIVNGYGLKCPFFRLAQTGGSSARIMKCFNAELL